MGTLLAGRHELYSIGATSTQTTSGVAARTTLVSSPDGGGVMFMVYCNQDVYIRQGDSSVTATSSDFLLKKDTYMKIVVRSSSDNHISALQVDTAGTIRYTELSDKTP